MMAQTCLFISPAPGPNEYFTLFITLWCWFSNFRTEKSKKSLNRLFPQFNLYLPSVCHILKTLNIYNIPKILHWYYHNIKPLSAVQCSTMQTFKMKWGEKVPEGFFLEWNWRNCFQYFFFFLSIFVSSIRSNFTQWRWGERATTRPPWRMPPFNVSRFGFLAQKNTRHTSPHDTPTPPLSQLPPLTSHHLHVKRKLFLKLNSFLTFMSAWRFIIADT